MKLARLIQPSKAAFWLMLAANAASGVLVWIVQAYEVTPLARAVIAVFALGNLLIGIGCAGALLRGPDQPPSIGK
jgi:hypothetical protein